MPRPKLTELERAVRDLITHGVIDGIPVSELAVTVVARCQGPSPITTKPNALPEDARRIARRFDRGAPPPPGA
ncbi:hypothetical protein [Yinghuangia soli]|uniref:Uncharacterized protein n=1 Tax=Yinghuangia soli TaxID=2908204 RepID=A0AA41Q7F1_9ACTN|nr:hypothetical protein [Yinghuangia soli]MCF2531729.1 hypothetical protein [Yinghuangia soli]